MEKTVAVSTRRYYRRMLFFYTAVIVLLGALSVGVGLLAFFPASLGDGYGAALLSMRNIERTLVVKVAGLYAVMTVLIMLAIAFLHVFFSHRIAGPAFRLGREAEQIGRGNLKANFQLRSKDNLTDMADFLKQAASRYRETIIALDRHATIIKMQAESLSGAAGRQKGGAAPGQAVEELSTNVRNIDKILSEIRA